MSLARVEVVCGGASASVDSDFRLDVDTPGFVMPTASQGHLQLCFSSMHPDPLPDSRAMRGFCELKIVASGFREKMLVPDRYPEGQMGAITLQLIRNPAHWSISLRLGLGRTWLRLRFGKGMRTG